MTAAATGIATLGTAAIKSYADYEQLVGGVDTLFKESSQKVQQYADNAYKTAGLSANAYMETVTSFSASLLQSLDGDTEKAADAADQAIIDMSDNANKMGTSMEAIQNAYNGFAKQNYTMLDNLKLGYGGTKEEMQRLLTDAEKISGIKYDISSFADVTQAIHVMQEEMGITGTTAKEASSTISGSIGMMKASWENLLTGMADENADFDQLISNFVDSVVAVGENLLPRIEVVLQGIGELITQLLPIILAEVPNIINDVMPDLLDSGIEMINAILTGIQSNLPTIVTGAMNIIMTLAEGILSMLPTILELGMQLLINLALGIAQALPELIPTIVETVLALVQVFVDNLPLLIDAGFQLLMGLITGIIEALPILLEQLPVIIDSFITGIMEILPVLIEQLPVIIDSIITAILENLPLLIECGVQLFTALVEALPQIITMIGEALPGIIDGIITGLLGALPLLIDCGIQLLTALVKALPEIISAIVKVLPEIIDSVIHALLESLPLLIDCGIQLFLALIEALPEIITEIVKALPDIIESIIDALIENIPLLIDCGIELFLALVDALPEIIEGITEAIPQIIEAIVEAFGELDAKMCEVGSNILNGIWEGISAGWDWLVGKVKELAGSLFGAAKEELDINSPSRKFKWLSEMCLAGFEEPMEDFNPYGILQHSMKANVGAMRTTFESAYAGGSYGSTLNMDYKTMKRVFTESLHEMNMVVQLNNREVGRAVRGYS